MNDKENNFDISPEFGRALGKAIKAPGRVGPDVDSRVMAAAAKHFAQKQKRLTVLRIVKWSAAAAAVLVVTGVLYLQFEGAAPRSALMEKTAAAIQDRDIDGNGKINIADALAIARGVESGRTDHRMDINGDGVVDKRDVDAAAYTAVRI